MLQEVEITGGVAGSSSREFPTQRSPSDAFASTSQWQSGRDPDGNGPYQPFPHMIWYEIMMIDRLTGQ